MERGQKLRGALAGLFGVMLRARQQGYESLGRLRMTSAGVSVLSVLASWHLTTADMGRRSLHRGNGSVACTPRRAKLRDERSESFILRLNISAAYYGIEGGEHEAQIRRTHSPELI